MSLTSSEVLWLVVWLIKGSEDYVDYTGVASLD